MAEIIKKGIIKKKTDDNNSVILYPKTTADQVEDLAAVAISGSYNDLINKPTIPTVNNGTLTIQGNGTTASTFTANQSGNTTLNIKGSGSTTVTKSANNEITISSSTGIPYGAAIMETNPFGGNKLYVNSLYNAFANADKKYYVTITVHKKSDSGVTYPYVDTTKTVEDDNYYVDGPVVSTLTSSAHTLFDGSYEGTLSLANTGDTYMKIRIMFGTNTSPSASTSYWSGYPYGKWYLSFYYNNTPNVASQARVYNKYAAHTKGWHLYTASWWKGSASGTNVIHLISDSNDYQRTCVDFIIYGNDTSGRTVGITEIDYQLDRPNLAANGATLTNFGPMTIYEDFTWNHNHATTAKISASGAAEFTSIKEGGTSLSDKYLGKTDTAADSDKLDGHDSSYFATASSVPTTYLKSASASGNTLTLTKQDNSTVTYTPSFTDTNYYHTPSYSSGLKIATGTGVNDMYVPNASGSQAGIVTIGEQSFSGDKTFASHSSYGGGLKFTTATTGSAGTLTGLFNSSSSSYPEINNIEQIVFHQGSGATHSADTYTTTLVSSSAPTANRTITLPNNSGTVLLSGTLSLESKDSSETGTIAYISGVSGGGATGSGTTKYLHFSAGSTPSRAEFTYATGSFTTAASMNYNTGVTTDNKYVYEISSTGASASGTATFVKTINGGSGSLTSQDNGGGGAIAYIASASHTPASLGDPDTGTVTISGGSYSGTTRYMKISPTGADTSSVGISGGSGSFYGTRSTSGSGTSARRTLTLSHSHTGASLTGTTTFAINGIKSVSLSESTTSTDGPAYTKSISGSAPSLGGTKTFVTGYPDFNGGSASHTTKYMLHTHTGASVATSGDAITGVTGGTTSATYRYMKFTAPVLSTTQAYQITGVGSVPSLESNTTASGGIAYLQDYTTTGTAVSGTTKYMKIKEKED